MKTARFQRYLPLVAAFAAGIVIATFALSRGAGKIEKPDTTAHQDHDAEHEESDVIRLSAEAIRTAGIEIAPVGHQMQRESLSVVGTVEANPSHTAKITPPVAGKLISISASVGDVVKRGQTLAVLQSPEVAQAHASVHEAEAARREAASSVEVAKSGLEVARAKLLNAEQALSHQKALATTGAFSQPSIQASQSELNDAQSELLQAQTELQAHAAAMERAVKLYAAELISKAELETAQLEHRQDQANVEKARARVAIARQNLDREQKIYRGDYLNRQAIQSAEADVRTSRADLDQARSAVRAAETALSGAASRLTTARDHLHSMEGSAHAGDNGRIALKAPISGVVTTRHATLGEAIERSTVAFEVENQRTVMVYAQIPEGQINRIRKGQQVAVSVSSYGDRQFAGSVQTISSKLDEKTRTLPVLCIVENPQGLLKPEMFAQITVFLGSGAPSIVLPGTSVFEEAGANYVFVQDNDGFKKRQVSLGRTSSRTVEIVSGLEAGERVVVGGVLVLKSELTKEDLKGHEH